MIEHLNAFPPQVVAFACKGHVSKRDYDTVLVPIVEKALKQHEKVRLYYQVDPDFDGIEAGAVWEDLKVGMAHLLRWERVAVVTDVEWISNAIRAFGFLMPGTVKIFSLKQAAEAKAWISSV